MFLRIQVFFVLWFSFTSVATANDLRLPDLGGASTGIISPEQEYQLGQQWVRFYRSQVRLSNDPFIQAYTEELIKSLSFYSQIKDKRLEVIVVDNPTLNAFAVPGGIIGVHLGLYQYARNEQEFSSVIAH